MANSPSHRFGQIIGDLLEEIMAPQLADFCAKRGLYLDKKGDRGAARGGKKVSWLDKFGNTHDLDFVIEKGGTAHQLGRPLAFIEAAFSCGARISGGRPNSSMACTTFWKPVPRSSQMRKRLNDEASFSLRDSGVVPIKRSGFLPGSSEPARSSSGSGSGYSHPRAQAGSGAADPVNVTTPDFQSCTAPHPWSQPCAASSPADWATRWTFLRSCCEYSARAHQRLDRPHGLDGVHRRPEVRRQRQYSTQLPRTGSPTGRFRVHDPFPVGG